MERVWNTEPCPTNEACQERVAAYGQAEQALDMAAEAIIPESPEALQDDSPKEEDVSRVAMEDGDSAEALDSLMLQWARVQGGCKGCPVDQLCRKVLKENPPFDQETGKFFDGELHDGE